MPAIDLAAPVLTMVSTIDRNGWPLIAVYHCPLTLGDRTVALLARATFVLF